MSMVSRLKKIIGTVIGFTLLPATLFAGEIKKEVVVNVPAYKLKLIETNENSSTEYEFDIAVGGLFEDRHPPPIGKGTIYEKRKRVLFFYGRDYPQLKIKKGDVIKWNNTFTPEGKPTGYKVPYQRIRSIGMKIKRPSDGYTYIDYVIHTALDEHTIGFAVSGGCIRVRMEDMLRLYDLIEPQKDDGTIKEIPLKINYDLVEMNNGNVILHANVYNKKIDYVSEFRKLAAKQGIEDKFDYEKISELFKEADEQFKDAYKEVRARSLKPFPGNYLPQSLREKLHKTFKLSDLETKVVKN